MSLISATRIGKPRKWGQNYTSINPDAMRAYIDRADNDHDYVKGYGKGDLYRRLPQFPMPTIPRKHQLQCFYLTTYYRSFLLYLPMGAGKTKIVIDTIRFRKLYHGMRQVLVITINLVAAKTWADEVHKHAPGMTVDIIKGTTKQRIDQVENSTADILVTNYHSLMLVLCDMPVNKKTGKRKSGSWKYNSKYLKRLLPKIDTLVVDEIQMISNYNSVFWRLADHVGRKCRFRFGMTGTPFGKDPLPIFGQFKLIDHGKTFDESVGMFRAVFYDYKRGFFGGKFVFNEEMKPALNRMIKNRSISYKIDEFADLPSLTHQTISCKQTRQMKLLYAELVIKMMKERKNQLLDNAFVNLRQCTSGFRTMWEGEETEDGRQLALLGLAKRTRSYIDFPTNPKLQALEWLIAGMAYDEKFIVFAEYTHSIDMISMLLNKMKIKHVKLYGKTTDKIGSLNSFYDDPECRGLVGNNVSASMAINPQHICRYGIFFETSVRPDIRQQAEARLHRPGQTRKVVMYDIVVENSIDEKIRKWLRAGKNLLQDVIHSGPQLEFF